jgi:hypothetical protein
MNPRAQLFLTFPGWTKILRYSAATVAAHGLLLWLVDLVQTYLPGLVAGPIPDWLGQLLFWGLAVPAMLLAVPFNPLLWKLGLMNAPGWFTWPKPLGFALVYAGWTLALLALALLCHWLGRARS